MSQPGPKGWSRFFCPTPPTSGRASILANSARSSAPRPIWRCRSGVGPATSRGCARSTPRSEEHTSELQSLMRISYAVFCLKKKTKRYANQKYAISHEKNYNQANDTMMSVTPHYEQLTQQTQYNTYMTTIT